MTMLTYSVLRTSITSNIFDNDLTHLIMIQSTILSKSSLKIKYAISCYGMSVSMVASNIVRTLCNISDNNLPLL